MLPTCGNLLLAANLLALVLIGKYSSRCPPDGSCNRESSAWCPPVGSCNRESSARCPPVGVGKEEEERLQPRPVDSANSPLFPVEPIRGQIQSPRLGDNAYSGIGLRSTLVNVLKSTIKWTSGEVIVGIGSHPCFS